MAQPIETLAVKLTSDTSEFSDGLDKANKKTSSFSSMASGALQGVGMAGVNMALSAASSFVDFASGGIDMASDLNETMSKVGVVFGDNSDEINAWAANAATALGQTKGEAMGAAASFGNLFVSMGLSTDSSADMSMNLVELAADLGSFNNMSTDEALEKLKAGMLGSAEPMQSLGVNMNAAMVTAKALEMGLAATADALTPAMLAQARYAIILEQTTTAQGDFAETSSGLANQQKIADAQWKELQTTLGTALLPVMLAVTSALNNLLTDVLPPLSAFISGTVTPAFQSIGDAIGPAITTAIGWFQSLGTTMQGTADGPMSYFQTWINTNMPLIESIVGKVLSAITAFWEENGETIMRVVNNTFDTVFTVIDTVLKTVGDLITLFLQVLNGDWEAAGETLEGIITRIWEAIGTVISNQLDSIRTLVTDIDWGEIGGSIVSGIASGITNAGGMIAEAAQSAAQDAYDSARDWLGINSPSKLAATGIGEPFGEGIGVGIKNAMGDLSGVITGGLGGMMAGAKSKTDGMAKYLEATLATGGDWMNDELMGIPDAFREGAEEIGKELAYSLNLMSDYARKNQQATGAAPLETDSIAKYLEATLATGGDWMNDELMGIPKAFRDAAQDIGEELAGSLGLMSDYAQGLIDTILPTAATQTPANTGTVNENVIRMVQNFYGPTDAATVENASRNGLLSALRQEGAR